MASQNTCDFGEFDPDGDLHNKSSRTQPKTQDISSLSFRKPTGIFRQVALSTIYDISFSFFPKNRLHRPASHAAMGGRFPGPPFRFTGLPVCRVSMRCFPAGL